MDDARARPGLRTLATAWLPQCGDLSLDEALPRAPTRPREVAADDDGSPILESLSRLGIGVSEA